MKDGDWITPDLIAPGLSFYDAKNIFQCKVTVIWLYEMIAKVHAKRKRDACSGEWAAPVISQNLDGYFKMPEPNKQKLAKQLAQQNEGLPGKTLRTERHDDRRHDAQAPRLSSEKRKIM
jgi:hypothetical protein